MEWKGAAARAAFIAGSECVGDVFALELHCATVGITEFGSGKK